jgi:hypothetical protein
VSTRGELYFLATLLGEKSIDIIFFKTGICKNKNTCSINFKIMDKKIISIVAGSNQSSDEINVGIESDRVVKPLKKKGGLQILKKPFICFSGMFSCLLILLTGTLFIATACEKGEEKEKESTLLQNDSTSIAVRKKKQTIIEKSIIPGFYRWYVKCTDKEGNETWCSGIEYGKKVAKDAAKAVDCGSGECKEIYIEECNYGIMLCDVNALIQNGYIEYIEVIDPWTNKRQRFTQKDIPANALAWLSEICDYDETSLTITDKVTAQLKVWNVYQGGNSVTEIISLHNLTAELLDAIAAKSWNKITIERNINDDETIHLDWYFEY